MPWKERGNLLEASEGAFNLAAQEAKHAPMRFSYQRRAHLEGRYRLMPLCRLHYKPNLLQKWLHR